MRTGASPAIAAAVYLTHRIAHRAAELGAGEILLNAMDADGTQDGFDLDLIRLVRREVTRSR